MTTIIPPFDFNLCPTNPQWLVQGQLWKNGNSVDGYTFAIVGEPTNNPIPPITLPNLPTDYHFLDPGTLWNDGGVVAITGGVTNPAGDGPTLSRLLDTIQVRVGGATESVVRLELGNVARNFFERSTAWRVGYTQAMTQAGPSVAYPIPRFGKVADVAAIVHALYKGVPLSCVPSAFVVSQLNMTGPPRQLQWDDTDYFVLTPGVIDADNPLFMVLALRTDQIEHVPDHIIARYYEPLRVGTLAALHGMPNKPWTNPAESQMQTRRHIGQISEAKRRAEASFVRGALPWRYPVFAVQRSVANIVAPLPLDYTVNATISPEGYDFSGLPTVQPAGPPGTLWSNGGELSVV